MTALTITTNPLKIQNVVATSDVAQKIDIGSFNEFEHLSSNLDLYRCGYVKDTKMVGRVTVFGNGKLISVGTKSPKQAELELKKAVRILKKYNFIKSVKIESLVRNIVGVFDLKKNIDLIKLAKTLPRCMYEPDQFAGLVYRMQRSCVALIFASGKCILVGAKSMDEINTGYFEVNQKISQ